IFEGLMSNRLIAFPVMEIAEIETQLCHALPQQLQICSTSVRPAEPPAVDRPFHDFILVVHSFWFCRIVFAMETVHSKGSRELVNFSEARRSNPIIVVLAVA